MGACGSNQFNPQKSSNISIRQSADRSLWTVIKESNFDDVHFKFLQEIQDVYTNTYGGFLLIPQIGTLIVEFKRFLYLIARACKDSDRARPAVEDLSGKTQVIANTRILPSPIIDRMWKCLITHTRLYEEFCMKTFGGILERDSTKLGNVKDYISTHAKLHDEFSVIDRRVWPTFDNDQKMQESFDGFILILLQDFLRWHKKFKQDLTQSYSSFPPQKQEEEMNKLRNKYLKRHPDELHPKAAFDMGAHNFYDGGEYTAQDPKGYNEPFVNAGGMLFDLGAPASQWSAVNMKREKVQMEPRVSAPFDDDGEEKDQNDDFFANFKAGVDFEDTEQSARGRLSTGGPSGRQEANKLKVTGRFDYNEEDVNPEFISDEEDDDDKGEQQNKPKNTERSNAEAAQTGRSIGLKQSQLKVGDRLQYQEESIAPEDISGENDPSRIDGSRVYKQEKTENEILAQFEDKKERQNDEEELRRGPAPPRDESVARIQREEPKSPDYEVIEKDSPQKSVRRPDQDKKEDQEDALLDRYREKKEEAQPVADIIPNPAPKPAARSSFRSGEGGANLPPPAAQPDRHVRFAGVPDKHEWLQDGWEKRRSSYERFSRYPIPGVVCRSFQREINVTVMLCDAIYNEYKRYLMMQDLVDQGRRVIPSRLVKLAWDYHLFETALYRKFCFDNFGHFIHTNPLPREVDDDQREDYIKTLQLYKVVFGEFAPANIWPSVDQQFNYDELYNFKYVNLKGYMLDILSKAQNKKQIKHQELDNFKERLQCIGKMICTDLPERGSQYIIEEERDPNEKPEQPAVVNPKYKEDPGAQFYQQPVLTSSNAKLPGKKNQPAPQIYNQQIKEEEKSVKPRRNFVTAGAFDVPDPDVKIQFSRREPSNDRKANNKNRRNELAAYV